MGITLLQEWGAALGSIRKRATREERKAICRELSALVCKDCGGLRERGGGDDCNCIYPDCFNGAPFPRRE